VKNSRRAFLKTTIASSAIVASIRPLWGRTEVEYDSTFDPWIEVYPANMRHNAGEVSARVGGRPILAVIKNNGYGLGLLNAAKALEPAPSIAGYTRAYIAQHDVWVATVPVGHADGIPRAAADRARVRIGVCLGQPLHRRDWCRAAEVSNPSCGRFVIASRLEEGKGDKMRRKILRPLAS
jgi:hypothetical protein